MATRVEASPPSVAATTWGIEESRALYNVEGWSSGYFDMNEQRHVVEEIVQFGLPHGVGIECGSKPELQAVLALSESPNHLIVCNGYKDEEFMRLAMMGQKLGHEVFIVIEQEGELDVLLRV